MIVYACINIGVIESQIFMICASVKRLITQMVHGAWDFVCRRKPKCTIFILTMQKLTGAKSASIPTYKVSRQ